MSAPVHFDLEEVERLQRKMCQDAVAQAKAKARGGDAAQIRFIELQAEMQMASFALSRMVLKAQNEGHGLDHIAEALGTALGLVEAEFIANAARTGHEDVVWRLVASRKGTVAALLTGKTPDDAVRATVRITGLPGGRA